MPEVRNQSEAEVSRILVALEGTVGEDVWESSLGVLCDVRGQAFHNGLEAFRVMDQFFYD